MQLAYLVVVACAICQSEGWFSTGAYTCTAICNPESNGLIRSPFKKRRS